MATFLIRYGIYIFLQHKLTFCWLSAMLHGLNFPIFGTLVTLGLASYGEFEFRRKVGIYFKLPNILPSTHRLRFEAKLAKDPPLRQEKDQVIETQNPSVEEVTKQSRIEAIISVVYNPVTLWFVRIRQYLCTTGLEILINLMFLVINYTHLIYLGNTFSSTDLTMMDTLSRYAQFHYISPILITIVLFYAHLL